MKMKSKLIAPCGMNCRLCIAYLRDENPCLGCRYMDDPDSNYIKKCSIRNCSFLKENNQKFCSDLCPKFPCSRLKKLDIRYKKRYEMSMLKNLKVIQKVGIREFLGQQQKKYVKGDRVLCVHNKQYYDK